MAGKINFDTIDCLLLGQGRKLFAKPLPELDETPWHVHSEYFSDSGIGQTTYKKPIS